MNKTKIEWADYTWNPIKGLCPERCWYCYARKIYQRFRLDPEPRLDIAELNAALHTKRTGKRIFVCSTFELFHPVTKTIHERGWSWRDYVFDVIRRRPDLTFIILTKRPKLIDRPMPANVWLGVSVTEREDFKRIDWLFEAMARIRFISFEPMLGPVWEFVDRLSGISREMLRWIIIGRLTGQGRECDPNEEWLKDTVRAARFFRLPIFLKNNLAGIWLGPLIQEFPMSDNPDDLKPAAPPILEKCGMCGEDVPPEDAVIVEGAYYHEGCWEEDLQKEDR